LIIEL
jgi:large subunit ribosomal protein L24